MQRTNLFYLLSYLSTQPSRGGKSATEVQLEQLHAQRRKLEGTLESVERRTEVIVCDCHSIFFTRMPYLVSENYTKLRTPHFIDYFIEIVLSEQSLMLGISNIISRVLICY